MSNKDHNEYINYFKDIETLTTIDIPNQPNALKGSELKEKIGEKKRVELLDYKDKYLNVYNKLRQNPSIYSLSQTELDVTAGGLNDAIQLMEEILSTGELDNQDKEETIQVRNECNRLVELLAD
jgi:hypothetical protein